MRVEKTSSPKDIAKRLAAKRHVSFNVRNQNDLADVLLGIHERIGYDYFIVARNCKTGAWDISDNKTKDDVNDKVFYVVLPPEKS